MSKRSEVVSNGGEAVAATTLEPSRQEISHRLPSFLPDGRHFLFLVQSGTQATSTVRVGSVDSTDTQPLGIVGTDAIYAQGFLLFRRDESLMAQPFDLPSLQLTGTPVALGDQVASRNTVYGDAVFSVVENGTLAYWNGGPLLTDVTWFSRKGEPLGTLGAGRSHYSFALSPDERRAVVEMDDDVNQVGNLWMVDVASGIRTRFTSGPANWGPVWSPDGSRVAYGSLGNGPSSLYEKPASGQSVEQLLLKEGRLHRCDRLVVRRPLHPVSEPHDLQIGGVADRRRAHTQAIAAVRVRGRRRTVVARPTLAGVHVERVWHLGCVRSAISCSRSKVAHLAQWGMASEMAGGRQGAVRRRTGSATDGRAGDCRVRVQGRHASATVSAPHGPAAADTAAAAVRRDGEGRSVSRQHVGRAANPGACDHRPQLDGRAEKVKGIGASVVLEADALVRPL